MDDWKPEPLVGNPEEDIDVHGAPDAVLEGKPGPLVKVEGFDKQLINFASSNFLSLVGNERIERRAIETVHKYGCGSCGPRGFYGTIDVHLDLEKHLAQFMGSEEAIIYGSGFNTIASAIPAFCKVGDLIIADELVNLSIQHGMNLSRSNVQYFRHNDMQHLEELLRAATAQDQKRNKPLPRRFIVAESIYAYTGDVAPLGKIVELKRRYRFRLCLDESMAVGVLGQTGRGLVEHIGLSTGDVEIITASLGHSFGSVAGFCCGSHEVIDHQRLSGAAYCFSASVPPFLITSADEALTMLEEDPKMLAKLRVNCKVFHGLISDIGEARCISSELSPLQMLQFANPKFNTATNIHLVAEEAKSRGLLVSEMRTVPQDHRRPPPAVRCNVQIGHTEEQLRQCSEVLRDCFAKVVAKVHQEHQKAS